MQDTYRVFLNNNIFSRHFNFSRAVQNATRLTRQYNPENIRIVSIENVGSGSQITRTFTYDGKEVAYRFI